MSIDPLLLVSPLEDELLGPQWNLYSYAANRPSMASDLSGTKINIYPGDVTSQQLVAELAYNEATRPLMEALELSDRNVAVVSGDYMDLGSGVTNYGGAVVEQGWDGSQSVGYDIESVERLTAAVGLPLSGAQALAHEFGHVYINILVLDGKINPSDEGKILISGAASVGAQNMVKGNVETLHHGERAERHEAAFKAERDRINEERRNACLCSR